MEPIDDVSDATSSASEGPSEPSPKRVATKKAPPAKRKATYYQRKDEIDALEAEVKVLKETLRRTQENSLAMAREAIAKMDGTTLRAFHADAVARNNLKLAGTQAMLSSYNQTLGTVDAMVPLTNYIYLPKDPDARLTIINALRPQKLQSTIEFMTERTRGLNLAVAQSQKERFDLPNGELAATGFVVSHIDTGHSLRQAFDAFMYFVRNQEISISEELGVLTIRDSDESDFRCGQSRFLSTLTEGIEIETNAAMFAACVDSSSSQCGYAVGVIDYVDHDELYPYQPDQRARKDMVGAMVMHEIPSISGAVDRPTIVVSWWYYVRFRPPTFGLDVKTTQSAHSSIARWHEVAIKVMRDRLATVVPEQ